MKKKYLTCGHCGKTDKTVERLINPYIAEIYNEEVLENICADCYHDLCMDV